MKFKIAIFISGRGLNLENILKAIKNGELGNIEIVCVFSNKIDAYGLEIAKLANIPTIVLESKNFKNEKEKYDDGVLKLISPFNPDLICLAGYMKLLTPRFISNFQEKIINIHPSLLPSFKGLDGQKQAFDYGVKIAGCTTHYVVPEMDAGTIISQAAVTLENCTNEDELAKKILKAEHYLYIYTLKTISNDIINIDELKEKAYKENILIN
jgi:phosphoribosylglycinamide formyltransferase-1